MRYYLDTEFIERGHEHPIELISIGLVAQDGREYYAVAADGWATDHASDWVKLNVIPHLGAGTPVARAEIAAQIRLFVNGPGVGDVEKPEFYGYYADYDWVLFAQLFGRMIDLPKGWPMFCRDVIQMRHDLGKPEMPKQVGTEHNALADARHIKTMHEFLLKLRDQQ